jgi:Na+/phosphate symporter
VATGGAHEQALPGAHEALSPETLVAVPPVPKLTVSYRLARRTLSGVFALGLFILSLQLMKRGATALNPIIDSLHVHGSVNYIGFGWISAYLLGSGSPVASVALTLFSRGELSDTSTYFMISGGRLGASFIVLFVGFLYYIRGRREPDGLYIGVVALMTTAFVYAAAIPVGYGLLKSGWLDGVRFGSPGVIRGVNEAYAPAVDFFAGFMPHLGLFVVGMVATVVSLKLFDAALPSLESTSPRVRRAVEFFHRRFTMFVLGIAITVLTVSVAVSLTILVPLSMKGIVRRTNIIPYVMGAQIGTFVDKLFVSLLLDSPRAFTIVFSEMVAVSGVSLIVLAVCFAPFRDSILRLAHLATRDRRGFALFLGAIFVVPLILLFV